MNNLRSLSGQERAVIAAMLQGKPETVHLIETLDDLVVKQMSDGEMGSLSLVPKGLEGVSRAYGRQLILGEFSDNDGVPVSLSINADTDGNLYEMDVWKVDFSPLLAWPVPSSIKILAD